MLIQNQCRFSLKRSKAFTLLELIVAMLISGIVLGMAMYVLGNVAKISHVYRLQQQTLYEVSTLHRLLTQDISQCEYLVKVPKGIEARYHHRTVYYELSDDLYILRRQGKTEEEFPVLATNLQCLYQHAPRFINEDIIDEIIFDTALEGETLPFHFFKMYAADVKMREESMHKE